MEPLRIGILGAARITELAAHQARQDHRHPAGRRRRPGPPRANAFAELHGIERAHESYLDVINDPEVEAIYNPLANSLHAPWNKAALAAGKLCSPRSPPPPTRPRPEVAAQVSGTDRRRFLRRRQRRRPGDAGCMPFSPAGRLGELRAWKP